MIGSNIIESVSLRADFFIPVGEVYNGIDAVSVQTESVAVRDIVVGDISPDIESLSLAVCGYMVGASVIPMPDPLPALAVVRRK